MKKLFSLFKVAVLLVFLILLWTSCKKELQPMDTAGMNNDLKRSVVLSGVPIPPLDWEHIDYMPTPPGTPQVFVPWASGASRQFAPELADDYKTADGWVLVYNTFNTTYTPDRWYFMLYNKFRGLLRMYYYIPATAGFIPSRNIIHALAVEKGYAASSPMMNFADQEVIDMTYNSRSASTVEQWQVAPGTWYALQFELAYDPQMSAQNFTNFSFNWTMRSANVTDIVLEGTSSGTLTGSISIPGTNFTVSPSFNITGGSSTSVKNGFIVMNGSSDTEKAKPTLGTQIINNIKTALTSGLQGIAKNILSGLFKKKTSTAPEENVSLKINTNISLKGTLTDNFLITSPVFAIPGYDQTATTGVVPAYNQPLGVFYLSAKPITYYRYSSIADNPGIGSTYFNTQGYGVDTNSYRIIFNPAVTSIADIRNIRTEAVALDPLAQYLRDPNFSISGANETIGDRVVRVNGNGIGFVIIYKKQYAPIDYPLLYDIGVRITFDVVPKNGAAPVTVSKTFRTFMIPYEE
ncbi:hypothetical protein ECE50_009180 [Chitinophaga sp. Mgbs1]|uniref:Uncharacterized protein n=1 Tax=Chitinophaga solisilvae TaxID=1233460 RepID=A0A9Q5CZD1_9BACT|nr:hypothetical protein [Chitinophaga solisilvae]